MDVERLAGKVSEAIAILERFRIRRPAGTEVAGCPEITAELVEIHGHALALERLAKLSSAADNFSRAKVDA